MMKMTSDSPQNMQELMHNCVFIKDGKVYYRDFERQIPLIEFARELNKHYSVCDASVLNDEAFSEVMYDDLQFAPEYSIDSLIATFYTALVGMAENRECLKLYETVGLPVTEYPKILQECIDTYGKEKQVDKLIEKMSELARILTKLKSIESGDDKNTDEEVQEQNELLKVTMYSMFGATAGVVILLMQLLIIYNGRKIVEEDIKRRIRREKERLKEKKE